MKAQQVGVNPTLIIGLGGTGKDILMRVRRLIVEHYGSLDNLPVVAFLSLDTDDAPSGVPEHFLGQDISLKPEEKVVLDTANIPPILENLAQYDYLRDWFPPDLVGIKDLKSGAKQIRALGRLSFYMGYLDVKAAALAKVKSVTDRDRAKFMLERYGLNIDNGVNVFVVASLCGGTGSGMLLDLPFNLKHWFKYDGLLGEVNGLFLMPGAFGGVSDRIKANGYACLKELNLYMGMGRAEATRFKAQYTSNPLDALDEVGPPYNFCYLIGDQNKVVDSARVTDLQEMVAQKIALEFTSNFARYNKSNRSNLEGVWQVTPRDAFGLPQNYLAFGLSSLRFPADRVGVALGARLGHELMAHWLNVGGDPKGTSAQLEQFLAKQKWVETPSKAHFYEALMQAGGGKAASLGDKLDGWIDTVKQDVDERTGSFSTNLKNVDAILWGHHKEMREKTRGAGNDPKAWGELARTLHDNMVRLRKETLKALDTAISDAANDPARGPRHALWLIDELQGTFEGYREAYLHTGKLAAEEGVKEKALHEGLADFDPLAEDMWLKVTMQLKGKLTERMEGWLERLKQHHRFQLEVKVREVGAVLFSALLTHLATLRTDIERIDQVLGVVKGELHALEKSVVAEILGLNYANTTYLFDASDVDAYYAERFSEPDSELKVLRALAAELLAPYGGTLLKLPALPYEGDRKALVDAIVAAAVPKFSEGGQPFKLDQTSVVERFFMKYPDRKKQEAVLHNLFNHSNPFIHVDGKQAAHKFNMTTIQKVVGLKDADSAHPPREVQEMLKVLNAACQISPGHIKPNPNPHTMIFIQEFGAFPLRMMKGLEGYKSYYEHYLDQHLHTTKSWADYPDLFPPDEAKLAEAQRALTLGLALGILGVDPKDQRTVVYHYQDRAGLSDTLELGSDEQAGVAILVAMDEARARLLVQIESLGKDTVGHAPRRALYDNLIRYAKAMEASLGTRHPRYQAQRAILGDFIKTYLMEEGKPAGQVASPAGVSPGEATTRYEALFQHYWVDRVIDAQERTSLTQAAATLGLTPEQTRAIEAKLQG